MSSPKCPHQQKGERQGGSLFRTPITRGEVGIPSVPIGSFVGPAIVRGTPPERHEQEGYLLVRICVWEGDDKEGARPLEGLNPFPNGSFGKQPSLSLFIIPAFGT